MSLAGKHILITRPIDQAETITRLLREREAEAVYFPTIQIQPPKSWDECDDTIDTFRSYDAVIFTSVNAVRYFFNRAVERGLQPGLMPKCTVYVVGAKTADAVASYGIMASRFPGVTNSKMLAEALCALPVRNKRFLFPKGNLAGSEIAELLRAQKATVDEVVVYNTAAAQRDGAHESTELTAEAVCTRLRSRSIDAVTFFSPSSVDNFFAIMPQDAIGAAVIAAIGGTTAEALRALSVPVHIVPAHPTSEELVTALDRYFAGEAAQ